MNTEIRARSTRLHLHSKRRMTVLECKHGYFLTHYTHKRIIKKTGWSPESLTFADAKRHLTEQTGLPIPIRGWEQIKGDQQINQVTSQIKHRHEQIKITRKKKRG